MAALQTHSRVADYFTGVVSRWSPARRSGVVGITVAPSVMRVSQPRPLDEGGGGGGIDNGRGSSQLCVDFSPLADPTPFGITSTRDVTA